MGKEISYFIIHFLIFHVLTMIEDIVERFYRNFFSYMAIVISDFVLLNASNDTQRSRNGIMDILFV